MKIPTKIQKFLFLREDLSMHLLAVSAELEEWFEENGADLVDPDLRDSIQSGCMIYVEPGTARGIVEQYIETKM